MKLPNAESAIIAEDKIAGYLLDIAHRRGGSKAKLLNSLGYEAERWQQLANDLRREHLTADVIEQRDSVWGRRYEIVAPLTGPTGDTVLFHSIWQIDLGTDCPRLITMYPE
jgi:Domain of unknown function (DUF6883)